MSALIRHCLLSTSVSLARIALSPYHNHEVAGSNAAIHNKLEIRNPMESASQEPSSWTRKKNSGKNSLCRPQPLPPNRCGGKARIDKILPLGYERSCLDWKYSVGSVLLRAWNPNGRFEFILLVLVDFLCPTKMRVELSLRFQAKPHPKDSPCCDNMFRNSIVLRGLRSFPVGLGVFH